MQMKNLTDYFQGFSIFDTPIINEHLKTLSPKVVLKQLNAKFALGKGMDIKVCGISNFNDKHPSIQFVAPTQLESYIDEIRLELDLMMWCLSEYWIEDGLLYLKIEPIQANQCNDYVYKDCHAIIYHLTDAISANRILKSGLRNRGHSYEKGEYRSIPSRTYFITGTGSNDVRSAINIVRKSFGKVGPLKLSHILRIDLTKYGKNLEFYHDTMYKIPNTIFAYSNIPGALITDIQFDDI